MALEPDPQLPLNQEFYQSVFDLSPFASLVLDRDMAVREVNQCFLQRYGVTRNQVLGQRCHQVFHNSQQPCPRDRCQFQEALKGRRDCFNLHQYTNRQGREVTEEVHLTPLTDGLGQIWGVVESIRDVSEAKRLENNLKEANEFLSRILDSLVGILVAADLDGKIIFVNRSVERVLGYNVKELVGRRLDIITDEEELRRINRTLAENEGQALFVRTFARHRSGEKVPGRVNAAYVYREGKPVATVGIFTDLRERLRMEDQVEKARLQVVQSDKLASLGRMAAGLAHELNNPLTGIMVFAELLKESLPEEDPAQADLAGILEDVERCQEIVRGMLDYSRQSDIRQEDLDLNQVVEDSFNLIRDNAVFLHVEVQTRYHSQPLPIQGDAKLLRQVFVNLIMNAVDAMGGQGRLTVVTGLDAQGWRYAEVNDTGPGIPEENLNRVFDPFFTTKAVGRGTGLGLSVVYGVMQRHGGSISVKETGPEGTTLLVRLPAQAPAEFGLKGGALFEKEMSEHQEALS